MEVMYECNVYNFFLDLVVVEVLFINGWFVSVSLDLV